MKNSGETKNEWILRELKAVKEWYKDRKVNPLSINIHQMASDCIDVIEDMERENQILRKEKSDRETEPEDFFSGKRPPFFAPEERISELDELGGLSKREEALQRFVTCSNTKSTQEVETILGVGPIVEPQKVVDVFSNKTVEEQVALLNKLRADLQEDIHE